MTSPSYGLVGRGRLATHLAHYLRLEGLALSRWHRGCDDRVEDALAASDILLLAISDDALSGFVSQHPALQDRPMVHFSGSLSIDSCIGLHPLMTFGPELYPLSTYRSVPFIAEVGGHGFDAIFPDLDNRWWPIDTELKPLYHALCVLAGNFTTLAWSKAMRDFEQRLGLPAEVLRPFLEQTAANTLDGGRSALTGSLVRADRGTVERDLAGLADDPYHDVYLAHLRAFEVEGATT